MANSLTGHTAQTTTRGSIDVDAYNAIASAEPSTNSTQGRPHTVTSRDSAAISYIPNALVKGCAAFGCGLPINLSRCTACNAVMYCSTRHQAADRAVHKSACTTIKEAGLAYQKAEQQLRDEEGDSVFKDGLPRFWTIQTTRPYMRARFAYAQSFLLVHTTRAVEAALTHLLDMLRLCHKDSLGVRDLVPALYLRLGQDQEAYDFCKWWLTTGKDGDHDWGQKEKLFLDLKDQDVFEDPKVFVDEATSSLSFAVAVTLIKIRLLIDVRALQRAKQVAAPKLPSEIHDQDLVPAVSSIVKRQRKVLELEDQMLNIMMLRKHVRQLFEAVRESSEHLWPALVRSTSDGRVQPMLYGLGNEDQMQVALTCNYSAWAETEGAIRVIDELLQS